jgi:hypothetical protein
MCRKTPYTGNGQTRIYGEAIDHLICGKFERKTDAHEINTALQMSVDQIPQLITALKDCNIGAKPIINEN